MSLRARQTSRHDLAVFLDEVLERVDVLVVDRFNAFGRKAAELLALEERVCWLARRGLPLP